MTNIIALRRPQMRHSATVPAVGALIDMFSSGRRDRQDAYWLKENAEILQILAATGAHPDLSVYAPYAARMTEDLRFFPQYYRMFLSIALDLAAMGMADVPVAEMAAHVVAEGLAESELSDTHRSEAALLLARAGVAERDAALDARLGAFAAKPARFALPNHRMAYDLTHLVFHAADYGRSPLLRDPLREQSLIHAGIVAYLDDNMDLLAEITIALRLSGSEVPEAWDQAVAETLERFSIEPGGGDAPPADDYHAYLVQNWAMDVAGGHAFAGPLPQGARLIVAGAPEIGTLRALSLGLLEMGPARQSDWATMRWRLWPNLTALQRARLAHAEALPAFEGFFAVFARAGSFQTADQA